VPARGGSPRHVLLFPAFLLHLLRACDGQAPRQGHGARGFEHENCASLKLALLSLNVWSL
jgi:hypothetical protein